MTEHHTGRHGEQGERGLLKKKVQSPRFKSWIYIRWLNKLQNIQRKICGKCLGHINMKYIKNI